MLFEPFTPAKHKGTAGEPIFSIGLSICKQVVQVHGGKTWSESRQEKETAFFVQLKRMTD